jgi:MazG family protein
MDAIHSLLQLIDQLLGPKGCPWDQKQTLESSRTYLLEEAAEVIEAIDLKDSDLIEEELGDLLFVVLFLARLAEKEKVTNLSSAVQGVKDKLIRRHPHVFGQTKDLTPEQVLEQWHEIKKKEKEHKPPQHPLDKIPRTLPALSRAAEVLKTLQKHEIKPVFAEDPQPESQIGEKLLACAAEALEKEVDPELALRKVLSQLESSVRKQF